MLTIKGKSLITTDWHFGLKGNSDSRLKILSNVTRETSIYMKENNIENFIFCGDWYHSRATLAVNTIHIAIKCLEAISRNCKNVYLIIGNHDLFESKSTNISSINMFKHIKNVHIISESTECDINGKKCLFVPWLGNLDYEKNSFDMIFGHFDINPGYLMSTFIEENMKRNASNEEIKSLLASDTLLMESGLVDLNEDIDNIKETYVHREKTSDLLGEWIEIVKEGGAIFAGHIHNHKESYAKSRKFILVGSPYQQTRGEKYSKDGFYTLDENGTYEFHEIKTTPRFVDVKMSEILRNIEGYNYSIVTNNIIRKVYDVEVDMVTDSKISRKIDDRKPFEELPSEYSSGSLISDVSMETIDTIKRSRLEYMFLFIKSIDSNILEEKNIKIDKLLKMAEEYYNRVSE